MDPFNMPAFGSQADPGARLQSDIAATAPLATQYHGAQTGVNIAQYNAPPPVASKGSALSQFGHFIGGVASSIGHIATGATEWLGKQLVSGAEAPIKFGNAIGHGWLDNMNQSTITSQSTQLDNKEKALQANFKAGRITSKDYALQMKEISSGYQELSQLSTSLQNRIKADQGQAITSGIQTASDLVTILTAGFGKGAQTVNLTADGLAPQGTKAAADYLTSINANAYLSTVESSLSKVASDPELFASLTPAMQTALQKGVAEVVSQSANMTAGQIARASVVNIALKYPIYYQAMSSTGAQLYNQLDNKKYGDAIRTVAFNAALLLSGGPIGKAMEGVGAVFKGAENAVFGQTAFLDELSKGIGNGTESGLYDAIMKLPEADRADVIHQMSAVETTNLSASGKDPVAAAWRVLNGMSSYEGVSMSTFSHDEALTNMVNFARAQRLASDTAATLGMDNITVGRVDARALDTISAGFTKADAMGNEVSISDRLSAWEQMKAANPNQAWANNGNFDKQVKALIGKYQDASSLDSAIRGIRSQFTVPGFPKSVSAELSKMGYIPIKPVNLEAPFTEGTGKVASKFGDGTFFTRTVQPLPILDSVGTMLTKAGLSPEASTQRVYEIFNQKVAENLAGTSAFKELGMVGDTSNQTADGIIKQLTDYSHTLSDRRLPIKAPITDLRLLTTNDVASALGVSRGSANEVKSALMDAMLKVPLEVRGLGDRVQDLNLRLNPLSRAYSRLQSAFRFTWNPFFQAKLATKTEFLSQAEGGGAIASIFSGDFNKLDGIRQTLRDAGIFDTKSVNFGALGGGESVAEGSAVGANLTHSLLPVQEKSIAGLIATQADKVGMDVSSFIKAFPNDARDTVQTIIGYDRNNQFLNSPLMRTLNLAFFPARFETKVATIMAKSLAAQPVMTQVAVIKGVYNASNWLKSTQGQAWYSQNSDAIGLFKYFSPTSTLSSISEALTGMSNHSLQQTAGAFELGGLPFGWIPQLLDAEGLTHFGAGYVNPKSGAIALDYVPVSARGQLQTAISDFLGSIFTYPGATAGLPSKGTITRWAAAAITGGKSKTDFQTTTPSISPQQQQFQQTVQALSTTKPNVPSPTPNNPAQTITVPAEPNRLTTPIPKPGGGAKKLKKAQFTPQLLPGQTSLGQL